MGLLPGCLTPWLHERLVQLGTRLPFAVAASELAASHQVRVSEATARRATERAGAAYVAAQTAEAVVLEQTAAIPPAGAARQLVSLDGAMVPLVGGRWAEVKTLAIGEVGAPIWDEQAGEWAVHTSALSYVSRLADAATFTRLATVETHRRGTSRAAVVCAVTDGAAWIQGVLDAWCPEAVRILDFPHAAQALATVAPLVGGSAPTAQAAWLRQQCQDLMQGLSEVVLARLRAVAAAGPPVAGEAARQCLGYLEKRREQITYAAFRAAGYPLGSGAVESANKLVVEARLKGAGMHWAEAHVNPMVALRTVICADRWAVVWPRIAAQVRARARRQPAQPLATAAGSHPPGTATVSDGAPPPRAPALVAQQPTSRNQPLAVPSGSPSVPPAVSGPRPPAPTHPWRRPRIGRAQRGRAA